MGSKSTFEKTGLDGKKSKSTRSFTFAGGSKSEADYDVTYGCSTLAVNLKTAIINHSQTPLLMSISQMAQLDCVIYCKAGIASFLHKGKRQFVKCERSAGGHLLLPLNREDAKVLSMQAAQALHFAAQLNMMLHQPLP